MHERPLRLAFDFALHVLFLPDLVSRPLRLAAMMTVIDPGSDSDSRSLLPGGGRLAFFLLAAALVAVLADEARNVLGSKRAPLTTGFVVSLRGGGGATAGAAILAGDLGLGGEAGRGRWR